MPDLYHVHETQKVYSDPNWRVNCSAYCGSMLIRDATLGGVQITGRLVRAESSEPHPEPNSPGLNITQIINVARKYRVEITDHQKEPWSEAMRLLDNGRRIMLQLQYGELGKYRCQANGDFAHAVVLVRPAEADGFIRVSDPLCSESKRMPEAIVKEAARVFARNTGISVGLRWCATRRVPETVVSVD